MLKSSGDRRFITEETQSTLASQGLMCLRNKRTKRIENVSYTNDGLKYTIDSGGKLLYYDNSTTKLSVVYESRLKNGKLTNVPVRVALYGNFKLNPNYEVVPYVPMNFTLPTGAIIGTLQSAELFCVSKAYALIKNMNSRKEYDADDIAKKLLNKEVEEYPIHEYKNNDLKFKDTTPDVVLVPKRSSNGSGSSSNK